MTCYGTLDYSANLKNMGINGKMFTYIKQFLSNRTIQVRVGNTLSGTHTLKNGTPQGSIISPILFLVMINDLPANITKTDATLSPTIAAFLPQEEI